jgi:hypothetical protein
MAIIAPGNCTPFAEQSPPETSSGFPRHSDSVPREANDHKENALRQSLLISKGSLLMFIRHPISAVALGFALLLLLSNVFPCFKKRRAKYEEFKE